MSGDGADRVRHCGARPDRRSSADADPLAGCRVTAETVLTNAVLVLPQEMMAGTRKLCQGRIAAVDAGRSALPSAIDLDGDMLIPGAVDLHSDNLERQVHPRITARGDDRTRRKEPRALCLLSIISASRETD
jgi:hypothetical protein